jgi:hypothetical protein
MTDGKTLYTAGCLCQLPMELPSIAEQMDMRNNKLERKHMADERRDIKFQLMLSEAELKTIDDWGFDQRVRTRAEAIRRLTQRGLLYDKFIEAVIRGGDAIAAALNDDPSAMRQGIDYIDFVSGLGVDIKDMQSLEAAIMGTTGQDPSKEDPGE